MGDSSVSSMIKSLDVSYNEDMEEKYVRWMESLPRYYVEGNTIFVHAGIDEGRSCILQKAVFFKHR